MASSGPSRAPSQKCLPTTGQRPCLPRAEWLFVPSPVEVPCLPSTAWVGRAFHASILEGRTFQTSILECRAFLVQRVVAVSRLMFGRNCRFVEPVVLSMVVETVVLSWCRGLSLFHPGRELLSLRCMYMCIPSVAQGHTMYR